MSINTIPNAMVNEVHEWAITHINPTITPANIAFVWSCKTLQNYKGIFAIVGVDYPEHHLFEATFNGDKDELYLDVYDKVDHQVIAL